MCLFIFKAKKKQKVSIKSSNGMNKLIFLAKSNLDISKSFRSSAFVRKLTQSFKTKDLSEKNIGKKEDEIDLRPCEKVFANR